MDHSSLQIVKSLVKMAWADGNISPEERSLLTKVLAEAGADPGDVSELDKLLSEGATGEPVSFDASDLDEEKRLGVMRALLIMSFMDGHVSFAEFTQIEKMQKELGISDEQLEVLRGEAIAAAETISAS